MRRALVVLAVLVSLVAAFWWRETTKPNRPAQFAGVAGGQSLLELEERALVPAAGPERREEGAAAETGRSEGLQVEVVDARDAPVAGADVYVLWIDAARESEFEEQGFEFEDLLDMVEEEGEHERTDERGGSWFSLARGEQVAVVARHGSSFGMDFLDELEPTGSQPLHVRIQVLADFPLTVRVLDHLGNPAADVPLTLGGGNVRLDDSTGADGEVEFEHVGLLCQGDPMSEWIVSAEVVSRAPVRQELGRLSGEATIVLQLPPTGSVEVAVEDVDGQAIEDGSSVVLFAPAFESLESTRTAEGVARFPHVEVGLELEAKASRGFAGHQVHSPTFSGPLRPGETVRRTIAFGLTSSVLPLRLRLRSGRSISGSLDVQIIGDTGRATLTSLDPVAHGSYRLDLAQQPEETRLRILLEGWTGKRVGARLEVSLPLPPGLLPEREVMLEDAPLLFAGRVIDPAGRPVVSGYLPDGAHDGLCIEYRTRSGFNCSGGSLHTDAEGRFEIRRALVDEETLFVRVGRWNPSGDPIEVRLGARDVLLVLDERE